MGEGGGLSDPRHYDLGSLLTLDVLLEPPVAGGVFCTTEPDGAALLSDGREQERREQHAQLDGRLERGPALAVRERVEPRRARPVPFGMWNPARKRCNRCAQLAGCLSGCRG